MNTKPRYDILDGLRDFLKGRFQFTEQSVVRLDLSVDFTAVGDQSSALMPMTTDGTRCRLGIL